MPFLLIKYHQCGFTLIELLITGVIAVIVISMAASGYQTHIDNTRNTTAIACIMNMQALAERYFTDNYEVPDSLADIPVSADCMLDPWNNPYQYLKIEGTTSNGHKRKDRLENPLNSDYDLYSMGKDGDTQQSLQPKVSHDDIIRAKNGSFVDLASKY